MFKTIRNYHKLHLKITPKSGFHIGAGEPDTSPVASDAEFVRVNTPWGRTVYMPGSSLKGVFRADAEALLKSMGKEVCDLSLDFDKKNKTIIRGDKDCGVKFDKFTEKSEDIYPNVCYSCKTFGNMKMSSVVRIEDFFPFTDNDNNKKEKIKEIEKFSSIRNGIKIDRYSGSTARGALYDFEVLNGGDFYGNIILKNPEIWQVLLIYKTISNINDGFVKVGGKKSRGLGNLNIEIESVEINTKNTEGIAFTKFDNNQFKDNNVEFDFGNAEIEKDLIGRKITITQKEDIKNYFKQMLDKLPGSW
jgi:CRISPR-associated RAMP protein (TIGR02581 family)